MDGEDDAMSVASGAEDVPPVEEFEDVDLCYEYDAPKWFDLCFPEPPEAAAEAEFWFFTVPGYDPSPVIAQLLAEDARDEIYRSTTNLQVGHCSTSSAIYDTETGYQPSHRQRDEWRSQYMADDTLRNNQKSREKPRAKGHSSRGSTLMKPTLSHLAKQIPRQQMATASRGIKPLNTTTDRSTDDTQNYTVQASKRQKLESGHLSKVVNMNPHVYAHKAREKNADYVGCQSVNPRVKLTVPREPNLETKRRAERGRIQRVWPLNADQCNGGNIHLMPTSHLEASHKLSSLHQSKQDATAGSVLSAHATNHRPPQHKRVEESNLPVRLADNKTLSSRADTQVSRCTRKSTTVPKEFNLSRTNRKPQQAPLSELFNKMSISSEAHRMAGSQETLLPIHIQTKEFKENLSSHMHIPRR